jgi:glycosyltransferase involved in cell wall biosynthesis
MKILFLLPGKYFKSKTGGCVSHCTGVVDAIIKMGHEVVFCGSDMIPGYTGEIEFYPLKTPKKLKIKMIGRFYNDYFIYKQLDKIIKSIKPDIIYVRWRQNLFWRALFGDKNYRVVFECNTPPTMSLYKYGNKPGIINRLFTLYLDRMICNVSDVISAVSTEVRNFLVEEIKCSSNKIVYNPNGVDIGRFNPFGDNRRKEYGIGKEKVVIGYSGSFRIQHGVEILIDAFKMINNPGLILFIIGTGNKEYEDMLRKAAKDDRRIIFTGEVLFNEMPAYLRTCDILVSPQKPFIGGTFHQSPIKLYEYMATGRAIVASNLGQIRDVIKDGINGLLFKSGDIAELKKILEMVVGNEKLREKLSNNARNESVKQYTWNRNVKRILDRL